MTKGDLRGFDKAVKRQEALAQNSKDLMTKNLFQRIWELKKMRYRILRMVMSLF